MNDCITEVEQYEEYGGTKDAVLSGPLRISTTFPSLDIGIHAVPRGRNWYTFQDPVKYQERSRTIFVIPGDFIWEGIKRKCGFEDD
jgi:hypothetical protein